MISGDTRGRRSTAGDGGTHQPLEAAAEDDMSIKDEDGFKAWQRFKQRFEPG